MRACLAVAVQLLAIALSQQGNSARAAAAWSQTCTVAESSAQLAEELQSEGEEVHVCLPGGASGCVRDVSWPSREGTRYGFAPVKRHHESAVGITRSD